MAKSSTGQSTKYFLQY